jgi:hypothetical protein
MTKIAETRYFKLRFWKEYWLQYTESAWMPSYLLDENEQLDVIMAQLQAEIDSLKLKKEQQ